MKARSGHPGHSHGRTTRTARKLQKGKDSWEWTVGKGQSGKESQEKTARKGQPIKDSLDRIASTGQDSEYRSVKYLTKDRKLYSIPLKSLVLRGANFSDKNINFFSLYAAEQL
jgi:hypothetical protein